MILFIDKKMLLLNAIESLSTESTIMMCGLPASGKSTVAKLISQLRGHKILSTDVIRLDLYKKDEIFDPQKAGDPEKRYKVYEVMFEQAKELIAEGNRVILDGTFVRQKLRVKAVETIGSFLPSFYIIHTLCDEETILKRIHARQNKDYESNALTEEAYFNNLRIWEDIEISELMDKAPKTKFSFFQVISTNSEPLTWKTKEIF